MFCCDALNDMTTGDHAKDQQDRANNEAGVARFSAASLRS